MKSTVKFQLIAMMFLMFFSWGAWYGQMSKYLLTTLGATGDQVGNAYTTFSIAAIFAPFFVGLIADRFFSAQKVMGFLNILGGVILYFLSQTKDPEIFFWYILAYTLCFAPNLALSNSIAMNQMQNPEKEFPAIRVTGTIAWIVVTNIIGFLALGDNVAIFQIAMYSSFALGIYAFFLPDTPPKADKNASIGQIVGLDALKLFKDRSFLIFFISSILICIPLAFYYQNANPFLTESGLENPTGKMAIGQISEALFLLLIPVFFSKYGFKKTILVGMLAWAIRYALFAYGNGGELSFMLIIGIALHGICYDFFFVSGQIYTNSKAGDKYKSAAQGLITLATYGVGMLIGFAVAGWITDNYKTATGTINWEMVWIIPAGIALAVFVLFALTFNDKNKTEVSH